MCLQSRPQSASAHKRKGWHALQQGTAAEPGHTGRQSNSSALYVRPDRTVNTNMALENSPSFPSLANFADALPASHTAQPANPAHPSKQNSWASPSGKQNRYQSGSSAGGTTSKPAQRYSAALSPAKASQERPQSKLSSGMAMSDSELRNITSLLSTHPWAEPGLARVSLPCMQDHCSVSIVQTQYICLCRISTVVVYVQNPPACLACPPVIQLDISFFSKNNHKQPVYFLPWSNVT